MAGIFDGSSTEAIRQQLIQRQSDRRRQALQASAGGESDEQLATGLGAALSLFAGGEPTSPELEASQRRDKLQKTIQDGMKEQGLEVGSTGAARFAAQVAMDAGDFEMAENAMGEVRKRSEQDQKSTRRGQQIEKGQRELDAQDDPEDTFQAAGAGRAKHQQNMFQRMELDRQDGKIWSGARKRAELDKAYKLDTAVDAKPPKKLTVQRPTKEERIQHKAIVESVYEDVSRPELAKVTLEAKRLEAEAAHKGETFDTAKYLEERAETLKQTAEDAPTPTAGDTFKSIKEGGLSAWEATKNWFSLDTTDTQPEVIELD